jgi:uncharacterized protein
LNSQIEGLANLAVVDAALVEIEVAIKKATNEIATLESGLSRTQTKLDSAKKQLEGMDKQKREAEIDIRSMQTQMEHSRDKMGRSRTERETNAVQREMEELRRLIRDREIEIEKVQASAAATMELSATEEATSSTLRADLDGVRGPLGEKLQALESDKAAKLAAREELVKLLPVAVYRRYDTIRQKRGFGVTTTTDGTCKACNISLAPQQFQKLKREPVLDQCPSCFRLIYFTPPTAASVST